MRISEQTMGFEPGNNPEFGVEVLPEPGDSGVPDHPADYPPGRALPPVDPPQVFLDQLAAVDPGFTVAWQPYLEKYTIWRKSRKGEWLLILPVEDPFTKDPIPLDYRTIALLIDSSPEHQGGVNAMFQQARKWAKEREQAARNRYGDLYREAQVRAKMHTQIRVGYGDSNGAKSARINQGVPLDLPANFKL